MRQRFGQNCVSYRTVRLVLQRYIQRCRNRFFKMNSHPLALHQEVFVHRVLCTLPQLLGKSIKGWLLRPDLCWSVPLSGSEHWWCTICTSLETHGHWRLQLVSWRRLKWFPFIICHGTEGTRGSACGDKTYNPFQNPRDCSFWCNWEAQPPFLGPRTQNIKILTKLQGKGTHAW